MPDIPVFDTTEHDQFIKNLYKAEWLSLLPGIKGRSGVSGLPPGLDVTANMGIDLIEMDPGASFPLHTHLGAHILFVLEGNGTVTIGEYVYETEPGDSYFIPGNYEHGVGAIEGHRILAIGFPPKHLYDPERMEVVDAEFLAANPQFAKIYVGADVAERKRLLRVFQQTK